MAQFEKTEGVYSKLKHELEEFLTYYQFLFDTNPKILKIKNRADEEKYWEAIVKHEYFRHHSYDRFGAEDYDLAIYNFMSDVYIDVLFDDRITNPKLEWIFALHLNLTDIVEVPNFLDYQLEQIFKNELDKFILYLECVVIEFEDNEWFDSKHQKVLQLYLARKNSALANEETPTFQILTNDQVLENSNSEKYDEKPLPPPDGWIKINSKIDYKQLKEIFSFLHTESNGDTDGLTFLTKAEVDELLMYGLTYPPNKRLKPFKLNISRKRTLKTIYYCFYRIYQFLNPEIVLKKDIVDFLINNFQNFENSNKNSLYKNIKNLKPPKMIFDLII